MKIIICFILILTVSSVVNSQSSMVFDVGTNIDVGTGGDICADNVIINGTYSGTGTLCTGPLPVELSSFTASVDGKYVHLVWQTETEVNNYGFDVERAAPLNPPKGGTLGKWEKIGFVEGHGNSNSPKKYSFVDKNPVGGSVFQYRLKQIDNDGTFEYSDIVEVELIPNKFELYQNYPNPFNPTTTIKYALPFESKVRIALYNSLGEFVKELVNDVQAAGYQEVIWNAGNVASGVYIYTIEAVPTNKEQTYTSIKKMILLK